MKARSLVVMGLWITACDGDPPPEPRAPAAFRSLAEPELAPPLECEPAVPEAALQEELQIAWLGGDFPWVRRVDEVVVMSFERTAVVGQYGSWWPEGMFVLAFDPSGVTQWEALLPATDELILPLVEPSPDGTWFVGSEYFSTTVWRYSPDGLPLVQTTVPDLSATRVWRTPSDGLLLEGVDPMQQSAFAELSVGGNLQWQGPVNLAPVDRAEARGVVQRLDPADAVLWEHDPRPEPFAGFPQDVGATWARLWLSGRVVAYGTVVGQGGDNSVLLGLSSDGQLQWSHTIAYATLERARAFYDERLLVHGRAWECRAGWYFTMVDEVGDVLTEGRSASPVLGIDAQGRVLDFRSYDSESGMVTLGQIGQVAP